MAEIAIVDDEKILVESLEIQMVSMGHTVKTFCRAQPFLDYTRLCEPDLVFLDLQLPDIHGMEVLRKIRQKLKFTHTIIITAHGNMESAIQALKWGAFDYINKPFDLDELCIIIDKALNKTKQVREVEYYRQKVVNVRASDWVCVFDTDEAVEAAYFWARLRRKKLSKTAGWGYWTREESEKFLGQVAVDYPRFYPIFLTLLRTGVRMGEAAGMFWEDVDFDTWRISLKRQYTTDRVWGTLKDEDERTVGLSPQLARVLHSFEVWNP